MCFVDTEFKRFLQPFFVDGVQALEGSCVYCEKYASSMHSLDVSLKKQISNSELSLVDHNDKHYSGCTAD